MEAFLPLFQWRLVCLNIGGLEVMLTVLGIVMTVMVGHKILAMGSVLLITILLIFGCIMMLTVVAMLLTMFVSVKSKTFKYF